MRRSPRPFRAGFVAQSSAIPASSTRRAGPSLADDPRHTAPRPWRIQTRGIVNDPKTRFRVLLVALWLTLSLAGVTLSWTTWSQLADTVDSGVRLAAQNDGLDVVFGALVDAETGERGFIITGKESYLTPLHEAETGFDEAFDKLMAIAS